MRKALKKLASFIMKVGTNVKDGCIKFVKDVYHHAEGAVLLVAASLGINTVLGEIPFMFALPLWLEATMVIPVLAVLIVLMLVKSAEWRTGRRNLVAA